MNCDESLFCFQIILGVVGRSTASVLLNNTLGDYAVWKTKENTDAEIIYSRL